MNVDDWDLPEYLIDDLRARVADGDEKERRRAEMVLRVRKIEGPLGDLLRTIATNVEAWAMACDAGMTTEAESIRMEHIADSAVACVDWLLGEVA